MAYEIFPLMGFPGETNKQDGNVHYQCHFGIARIALWNSGTGYALNIYKPLPDDAHRDDTLTDHCDRYDPYQRPIKVGCVFEAQLAINYLIQIYLPTEVTNDFSNASEGAAPAEDQARALYAHAATGEALE